MYRTRSTAPYTLTLKYPAVCAETGAPLPKGTEAIRYGAKYYGMNTKTAEQYRADQFARTWSMMDANY